MSEQPDAIDEFPDNPNVAVLRRRRAAVFDPIVARLRDERLRRRAQDGLRGGRWTQAYVARQLGVGQPTVSEWEQGNNLPRLPQLRAWAALFDLDLTLILQASEMAA